MQKLPSEAKIDIDYIYQISFTLAQDIDRKVKQNPAHFHRHACGNNSTI